MPVHRFSGTLLAVIYAATAALLVQLLPMLVNMAVPLMIFAAVMLLAGTYTVDLKKLKAKRFAFTVISYGCLAIMLLMGGNIALESQQQGGSVVFLLSLVILFMGYLTGLALEARAYWLTAKEC